MHRANLTIITIPVLLLAATVAISVMVSDDAFARERYSGDSTSQAAAVSNECLNPVLDSNTIDNVVGVGNCGGTVSQQEESGQASAPITHQTANPTIEVQRSQPPPDTESPPETCEDCFNMLTDAQQSAFEAALSSTTFPAPPFSGSGTVTTIEELCEQWKEFSNSQRVFLVEDLGEVFVEAEIPGATQASIISCLLHSVG